MQSYTGWLTTVLDVLESSDEEACLALIHCTVPGNGTGVVALVEGDVSAREALAYARVMMELGHDMAAEEVVGAVIQAELSSLAA